MIKNEFVDGQDSDELVMSDRMVELRLDSLPLACSQSQTPINKLNPRLVLINHQLNAGSAST